MRVIIQPDYELASKWAAHYVAKKINDFGPTKTKPFLLGLPTGSSPLGMYKELIKLNSAKKVTFKNVITFNMDEYVGLPEDHPASYHYYMRNNFFNHIDIPAGNINILDGNAKDLAAECERYEKKNEAGGRRRAFHRRSRPRRTHRLQRTRLVACKPNSRQNPHAGHRHRQLALL